MTQAVETFFGGSATAAKFEDRAFGTVIGGVITDDPRMVQQRDYTTNEPIVYPDGNPAMQMVVTVQAFDPAGDDDGRRAFYIKGQLKQAVGEALRKHGEKAPRKGGQLWVKYIEDKPTTLRNGKPGNPQKIHAAKYEPPAQAATGAYFDNMTPADEAPPPGVDPATWSAMNAAQREQMRQALGAPALSGKPAYDGEPPF